MECGGEVILVCPCLRLCYSSEGNINYVLKVWLWWYVTSWTILRLGLVPWPTNLTLAPQTSHFLAFLCGWFLLTRRRIFTMLDSPPQLAAAAGIYLRLPLDLGQQCHCHGTCLHHRQDFFFSFLCSPWHPSPFCCENTGALGPGAQTKRPETKRP